jgi:Flp pilus assembly protein TadD
LESLQSAHESERQAVQPASHQTPVRATAAASTSPAKPLSPAIQEWLDGGVAALADGNSAAAAECFQRAMELDPQNPHIATTATIKALEALQPELAVAVAQSGLTQMPQSAPLYGLLGTAQYRMGNLELAEAAFIQAVNLDNTHAVSYFLLGCTQSKLGRHEDARLNLQQARKLNPRYVLGE